ncbi:MAG: hypothetical protein A2X64_01550 [Ignavibacteria bacterium GWF2_33_9]|nr:MAG: hypothetical protein A2X64_01550 [Ignavibacteria bacterium GWF2_33_9]
MQHKKIQYLLIFLALGLINQANLYSQFSEFSNDSLELKPKYGILFGYDLNFHSADFRSLPGVPSCCPQFTGGTGNGLMFGALLDYPINPRMEVNGRITYNTIDAVFSKFEATTIVLDGEEAVGEFEHYVKSNFALIGIEPYFTYKLNPELAFHGGFRFGFLTKSNYYQIEKISKPTDRGTFLDGRTYRNQSRGSLIDSANRFQFGIKLGTSYTLPANKKKSLFIVPEIFYTLNPTNIYQNRDWSINSLTIGIGIKYRIPPPPPPPPTPPIAPPDPELPTVIKQPILAVDVDAVEIDSNNVVHKDFTISVEDFISINMRPLLTYVFFVDNSAQIPSRYKLLARDEINKFSEEKLVNLNAIETYYDLLNIIGKRMSVERDASITLTGTNADVDLEKNNQELSRNRAQSVADYLINTWSIDSNRIKVQYRNLPKLSSKKDDVLGQQENRRVEITSENIRITEPVLTKDTIRAVKNSDVRFIPKVLTEVGLQYWELSVKQRNNNLFSQKGNGQIPDAWDWKMTKHNAPTDDEDLSYNLSVIDSIGQSGASKVKRIPMNYVTIDKKRRSGKIDTEYEYYSLILFDFGKSDLGFEHRKVVDFVKDRISNNSIVVVSGYTDAIGDENINDKISKERAEAVLKRLNINQNVSIEGKGESVLLYDNALPEGRFYCRTVTIDIETPINK